MGTTQLKCFKPRKRYPDGTDPKEPLLWGFDMGVQDNPLIQKVDLTWPMYDLKYEDKEVEFLVKPPEQGDTPPTRDRIEVMFIKTGWCEYGDASTAEAIYAYDVPYYDITGPNGAEATFDATGSRKKILSVGRNGVSGTLSMDSVYIFPDVTGYGTYKLHISNPTNFMGQPELRWVLYVSGYGWTDEYNITSECQYDEAGPFYVKLRTGGSGVGDSGYRTIDFVDLEGSAFGLFEKYGDWETYRTKNIDLLDSNFGKLGSIDFVYNEEDDEYVSTTAELSPNSTYYIRFPRSGAGAYSSLPVYIRSSGPLVLQDWPYYMPYRTLTRSARGDVGAKPTLAEISASSDAPRACNPVYHCTSNQPTGSQTIIDGMGDIVVVRNKEAEYVGREFGLRWAEYIGSFYIAANGDVYEYVNRFEGQDKWFEPTGHLPGSLVTAKGTNASTIVLCDGIPTYVSSVYGVVYCAQSRRSYRYARITGQYTSEATDNGYYNPAIGEDGKLYNWGWRYEASTVLDWHTGYSCTSGIPVRNEDEVKPMLMIRNGILYGMYENGWFGPGVTDEFNGASIVTIDSVREWEFCQRSPVDNGLSVGLTKDGSLYYILDQSGVDTDTTKLPLLTEIPKPEDETWWKVRMCEIGPANVIYAISKKSGDRAGQLHRLEYDDQEDVITDTVIHSKTIWVDLLGGGYTSAQENNETIDRSYAFAVYDYGMGAGKFVAAITDDAAYRLPDFSEIQDEASSSSN